MRYFEGLGAASDIVLGPVPREGEDQAFSGGFTIAAERCPNRRGIERVVQRVTGRLPLSWSEWLEAGIEADCVWITGGYPTTPYGESDAEALSQVSWLVVQDLFDHPVAARADLRLPSVAWAERQGAYVNANDHLQAFSWGVRPPVGCRSEGQVFWQLGGRKGLYHPNDLLAEMAETLEGFSAARPPIAETGVSLAGQRIEETEVVG